MFSVDDYVVYSNTGVCRVVAIGTPEGFDAGRIYYTLKPVNRPETVFLPVDSESFIRGVISRQEAMDLVDRIPSIKEDTGVHGLDPRSLGEHYRQMMSSHECDDLVRLIKTIYMKGKHLAQNGKKLIKTDADFKKRAEDILYNELSVALGIPAEEMEEYIVTRLDKGVPVTT